MMQPRPTQLTVCVLCHLQMIQTAPPWRPSSSSLGTNTTAQTHILSSLDKYKRPYEMKSDLIVSVDINNAEQYSMW